MSDFLPKVGAVYRAPYNPANMKVVIVEILADQRRLKYKIIEHDDPSAIGGIIEYGIRSFLEKTKLFYEIEGFEV